MVARRRRRPGRWLAPVALVTCAVAVYAVVHSGLNAGKGSSSPTTSQRSTGSSTGSTTHGKAIRHRRRYIVKPGDTLSAISLKTGVSLDVIQRLNPHLDAQTLHAGQKVRLAP